MKLFAVCGVLPGGLCLAGAMMIFVGCAQFQARTYGMEKKGRQSTYGMEIRGRTFAPEKVILAHAEADAVTAQAYAVRRCSDDSKHCGPLWGGWGGGGYGELDTPAGVTWSGLSAAASYNRAMGARNPLVAGGSGTEAKDVELLKRSVAAVAKHQAALGRAVSALAEKKPEPMRPAKKPKRPPKKPAGRK